MANHCKICVAITGSLPTKADNPAVPINISEQIESTQAAFEAAFDVGHMVEVTRLQADGLLKGALYIQFAVGVKNAMPAHEPNFDHCIETLKLLAPDALLCAAGICAAQMTVNE